MFFWLNSFKSLALYLSILNEPRFEGNKNVAVAIIWKYKHIILWTYKKGQGGDESAKKSRKLDWNSDMLFTQWRGTFSWTVLGICRESLTKNQRFLGAIVMDESTIFSWC